MRYIFPFKEIPAGNRIVIYGATLNQGSTIKSSDLYADICSNYSEHRNRIDRLPDILL